MSLAKENGEAQQANINDENMQDYDHKQPSEKDIVQPEDISNAPTEKCLENHMTVRGWLGCSPIWSSSFLKKYGPMIPPAHKAHQTVSFSGCNGVSAYTCGLVTPNAAVLFVDVAIQPEVRFIFKQNSLMKIGNTYSAQNHYFRNKIAQFESVVEA
ncbi:hypothetical protein TNCV_2870281 [Trichonephila clavipes]|nr:hypothetical protein TNCV_2870281 [Trichonephila clavipes]